jgi:GTP-binding protein
MIKYLICSFNLDATEEQLNFKTVYGSSKQGWMGPDWKNPTQDVTYLLDTIIDFFPEAPSVRRNIANANYIIGLFFFCWSYCSRTCSPWFSKENMPVSLVKRDGSIVKSRIKELFIFEGLGKAKTN